MTIHPIASAQTGTKQAINGTDVIQLNTELPSLADVLKSNPTWLDEAVDTAEASRITGLAVATLSTLRSRGGGPSFIKVGQRAVRYQRRQLLQFLAERRRSSTSCDGTTI